MKNKGCFLFVFVFVLFLPGVFAENHTTNNSANLSDINIKISKKTYQPRETFQAEISGNLYNLNAGNIKFYKKNTTVEINLFYDFAKINNIYYVYAILPAAEKEYDFAIKDIRESFSVKGDKSEFNFNPGFIITKNDFFIWLNNNLGNQENISVSFSNESREIILYEGESRKIPFSIQAIDETGVYDLTISGIKNYAIPVYAIKPKIVENISDNDTDISEKQSIFLRFSPQYINSTIKKNEKILYKIKIINPSQYDVKNITFSFSKKVSNYVEINPEKIDLLPGGKSAELNLTFVSNKDDFYLGQIIADSYVFYNDSDSNISKSKEFLLHINVTSEQNITPSSSLVRDQDCSNIGQVCDYGKICSGDTVFTPQGACCTGQCVEPKKKKINWALIIFLIVLIAVVVFVIIKAKSKSKIKKTPKDVIKEREKNYLNKFKIKGGLSRT